MEHAALESLDLSENLIIDSGGDQLARSLKQNSSLNVIKLRQNFLQDATGGGLLNTMRTNKSLKIIDLAYNYVSSKYIDGMQLYLNKNL